MKVTKCPIDPRLLTWSQASANTKSRSLQEPVENLVTQQFEAKRSTRQDRTAEQKKEANSTLWNGLPTYFQKRACAKLKIKVEPGDTRRSVANKLYQAHRDRKMSLPAYRIAIMRNFYKKTFK